MSSFPTRQIARLSGHNGQVLALTYSSGSATYLLTGSTDRQIRLFNPSPGAKRPLIQTYSAHGYEVLDLQVSTDNSRFVSCGGDKAVFLWDVASATTTRRFSGHLGRVNGVRLAGEGEALVVSGSYDGTVKVWDTKQRGEKPLMSMGEAKDSVSCVDVRGWEVLAGSVDGKVRCYDFRMGEVRTDVLGPSVTSITWDKAGEGYLVSTLDSKVRLMDVRDGKCLQTFKGEGYRNEGLRIRSCFAMADELVLAGSEEGDVFVWDVLTGHVKHRLGQTQQMLTLGQSGPSEDTADKKKVISAVAWNQLRKEWATAGGDGTVVVWGHE